MEDLLKQLENQSLKYHDGHYTIYKFTTHYKVCFGTTTEREDIKALVDFETLKEAIIDCLINDTAV